MDSESMGYIVLPGDNGLFHEAEGASQQTTTGRSPSSLTGCSLITADTFTAVEAVCTTNKFEDRLNISSSASCRGVCLQENGRLNSI